MLPGHERDARRHMGNLDLVRAGVTVNGFPPSPDFSISWFLVGKGGSLLRELPAYVAGAWENPAAFSSHLCSLWNRQGQEVETELRGGKIKKK